MTPHSNPAPEPIPVSIVQAYEPGANDSKARAYHVLSRLAYWAPVIAVVVLFAQVSFLGLRPALSEARRLSEAEETLTARHAVAVAQNQEIAVQLSARADPIFRERQRRLRTISAAPTVVPQTPTRK